MTGRVVKFGPRGLEGNKIARQRAIRECLAIVQELALEYPQQRAVTAAAAKIGAKVTVNADMERGFEVGDRVAFPATVGQEVRIDGTDYILMWQDDVVAVIEERDE